MERIKKGDLVEVKAGKDKGRRGKVLRVYPKRNRVLVQGVNVVRRHMRRRRQDMPGGIIEIEAPLHLSNVMPVCNRCGRGTRVGYKILEDGSKLRICRRCGETI